MVKTVLVLTQKEDPIIIIAKNKRHLDSLLDDFSDMKYKIKQKVIK